MKIIWVILLVLAGCSVKKKAPVNAQKSPTPTELKLIKAPLEATDLDPDPDILHVAFEAAPQQHTVGELSFEGFAYNGQFPGPLLRAKIGDTLKVDLKNSLDMPTTIHWHGIDVPFAMDGVTWKTAPVNPGQSFTYEFKLTRAGTFWYHPHFNTSHQVDNGLYGAIVVEDPTEPTTDDELILVFDGLQEHVTTTNDDADKKGEDHEHKHTRAVISRWIVNGQYQPSVTFKGGTRVRARFVNVSNAGYLDLRMPNILQVASDQGRLPQLNTPENIVLGPGDRAEVIWLIGEQGFELKTAPYTLDGGPALANSMADWSKEQVLLKVNVDSPKPAPKMGDWPWSNEKPTPAPGYTDIVYTFSGSPHTGKWLINGERFPEVTIEEIPLGETRIIDIHNLSPTEHPFHLHGHAFEVLTVNGKAPAFKTMEDTFNIRIRDRVRLRLIADNPGDWMTHCHILPHAGGGLMTVLRVKE